MFLYLKSVKITYYASCAKKYLYVFQICYNDDLSKSCKQKTCIFLNGFDHSVKLCSKLPVTNTEHFDKMYLKPKQF